MKLTPQHDLMGMVRKLAVTMTVAVVVVAVFGFHWVGVTALRMIGVSGDIIWPLGWIVGVYVALCLIWVGCGIFYIFTAIRLWLAQKLWVDEK